MQWPQNRPATDRPDEPAHTGPAAAEAGSHEAFLRGLQAGVAAEVAATWFELRGVEAELEGEGHVVDLQQVWARIGKTAGLDDVRLHDLRHLLASGGASSGDSLLVIGALLGHRSAKTTERYAHLANHPVKSAAERISHEISALLQAVTASEADAVVVDFATMDPEFVAPVRTLLGDVVRTRWLDTRAAAVDLGLAVGTLETYRWLGVGPSFQKIGRRLVYAEGELDAWQAARTAEGTV